mmetsp:Transcript_16352/g.39982  ORF Transcript_16352/g.39982 Transcript_16352/m.39982 type:complete len:329 (+) Transcript_16352:381-1367(+)
MGAGRRRRGGVGNERQPRGRLRVPPVQGRRRGQREVLPEEPPGVRRQHLVRGVPQRHALPAVPGGDRRGHIPGGVAVGPRRRPPLPRVRQGLRQVRLPAHPCAGPGLRHAVEPAGQLLRRVLGLRGVQGGRPLPGQDAVLAHGRPRRLSRRVGVRQGGLGLERAGRGGGAGRPGAGGLRAVVALGLRGEHPGVAELRGHNRGDHRRGGRVGHCVTRGHRPGAQPWPRFKSRRQGSHCRHHRNHQRSQRRRHRLRQKCRGHQRQRQRVHRLGRVLRRQGRHQRPMRGDGGGHAGHVRGVQSGSSSKGIGLQDHHHGGNGGQVLQHFSRR